MFFKCHIKKDKRYGGADHLAEYIIIHNTRTDPV